MNGQISDNELESLISDNAELSLEPEAEQAPEPATPPKAPRQGLSLFGNIPVKVTLEVASAEVSLKDLLEIDANSVIQLDKVAGEPLDMKVNGAPFAKAEVVVINGNYGIRIVELYGSGLSNLTL